MGSFWMILIPIIPLGMNFFINYLYYKHWEEIDPPEPGDDEKLLQEEVQLINRCD